MEGMSLAGSGVSIAYVAKELEHVCTNSTVGPSAAGELRKHILSMAPVTR